MVRIHYYCSLKVGCTWPVHLPFHCIRVWRVLKLFGNGNDVPENLSERYEVNTRNTIRWFQVKTCGGFSKGWPTNPRNGGYRCLCSMAFMKLVPFKIPNLCSLLTNNRFWSLIQVLSRNSPQIRLLWYGIKEKAAISLTFNLCYKAIVGLFLTLFRIVV